MASSFVKGQALRSFTPDSITFIEELSSHFDRISNKENHDEAIETLEAFQQLWISETFNPKQKQAIYTLSNLMLSDRVKTFPHFQYFLKSLILLKNHNFENSQLMMWMEGLKQALEKSRSLKDFNAIIECSVSLLSDNILYSTRVFTWQAEDSKFSFNIDSTFHVDFENTNLTCSTKPDSAIIYNTSGSYYPTSADWFGESGKITWERAGLDPDKVFARFGAYDISLKSSHFTIKNVNFYNLNLFPEPLPGTLTEKISSNAVKPESANYPFFKSSVRKLFIRDVFKDIDYEGGFAMKGANILGESDESTTSKLTFKRAYRDKNGKYDLLTARSNTFIIKPDLIMASRVRVAIYHQDDSIFHSAVQFKYLNKSREVSLFRKKEGIMESLYFDTFHNIDIDCEAVYWKMDQPEIRFGSIMGIQPSSEARFISDKYFIEQQYDMLQGLDLVHPLIVIYSFYKKYNRKSFFVYELAEFMKMPENPVERQMIRLAKYGFVFYNTDSKQVVINDKLFHYIAAKNGRADYDVISFFSVVKNEDNATLSLDNFDMKIRGVPRIFISDSQSVYIYPTKEEVILRKNKDFLFSGNVEVGLFEFKATDCLFEYDTFKLNMPTIDEMRFKVRAFDDKEGEKNFVDVKTVISDISGELFIDFPSNKNSLRDFPEYPIFKSNSESFVFYNQDSIHNNAYNPETFNYLVKPFTINKLADYSNNDLQFGGSLSTAGIFPPEVSLPLRVMPDYSLGFQIISPTRGYPVYGGKGTFYDTVTLSNSGLRASGTIKYLNTVLKGRDILLYPDSAIGRLDEFTMTKKETPGAKFPAVGGQNLTQLWLPYQDSLMLATNDSSFVLFDNKARLKGSLTIATNVMTGAGKLDFRKASATSNGYTFGAESFMADTLNLTIKNLNEEALAFSTGKFSANVDFRTQTGNFKSVTDTSMIEFPTTRYTADLDEFDWYMNRNEIELKNSTVNSDIDIATLSLREMMDITPDGSRFTSIHALQDSLWFYAPAATFNLADNSLTAKDVKYIKVADAAIFPGNGIVEIKSGAAITPLINAIIIADTINKIHQITNAAVKIESRYSYKAAGTYTYFNLVDETQVIDFDRIRVDTSYHTIAEGKILPEQSFMFSPQFTFQGEVMLNAREPELYFDGAYQIVQDCDPKLSKWVKFQDQIKPDSLAFPVVPEPEEYGKNKLYAGFFHSNEENRVYPAFLSKKAYYSDTLMMTVEGEITARKKGSEFLIAAPEEIGIDDNKSPLWPYMTFDNDECKITASGPVSFGTDFGKVEMQAFGQTEHFVIPDSTLFHVFITLDFYFNDEALEYLSSNLNTANTKGVEPSSPLSGIAYRQLLGTQGAKDFVFDLNSFGSSRDLPDELNKSIVISDVTLSYHPESRSFISVGQIGIGMIGGKTINKYFEGNLEIVRKRSGDIIQLYIEIDRRHWYFFNHTGNLMQTISSKNEYNRLITDEEAKKRTAKAKKGETAYRYIISTNQKKNRFLREVRSTSSNDEDE